MGRTLTRLGLPRKRRERPPSWAEAAARSFPAGRSVFVGFSRAPEGCRVGRKWSPAPRAVVELEGVQAGRSGGACAGQPVARSPAWPMGRDQFTLTSVRGCCGAKLVISPG